MGEILHNIKVLFLFILLLFFIIVFILYNECIYLLLKINHKKV